MCSTDGGTPEINFIQLPFIKSHSRVLHTLADTAFPHGYCGCVIRVQWVCFMGTAHTLYRVRHQVHWTKNMQTGFAGRL